MTHAYLTLTPVAGAEIFHVASVAIQVARATNCPVRFTFNGVTLTVDGASAAREVSDNYLHKLGRVQ